MKQIIQFIEPTQNPEEAVPKKRHVIMANTGIGMTLLREVLKTMIPIVEGATQTIKEILYTDRFECPCCETSLKALVRLSYGGGKPIDNSVLGLYWITMLPDARTEQLNVIVSKLTEKEIARKVTEKLPKKSYP